MEIEERQRGWLEDRTAVVAVVSASLLVTAGIVILFGSGLGKPEPLQVLPGEFSSRAALATEPVAQGWNWLTGAVWNLHPGRALDFVSSLGDRIAEFPLFTVDYGAGSLRERGSCFLSPFSDPVTLLAAGVLAFWFVCGEAKRLRRLMKMRRK